MTLVEFRSWLDGYAEASCYHDPDYPNQDHLARIQFMQSQIDPDGVDERRFVQDMSGAVQKAIAGKLEEALERIRVWL